MEPTSTCPTLNEPESFVSDVQPQLLERLFLRALGNLRSGRLRIFFPSGACVTIGDTNAPLVELLIKDRGFFRQVMSGGSVAFGEAYVEGHWETSDLSGLLTLLANNQREIGKVLKSRITPRLSFVYDDTDIRGRQLSDLIDSALASDRNKAGD